MGHTAATACCLCGGGSFYNSCQDVTINGQPWTDAEGDGCNYYDDIFVGDDDGYYDESDTLCSYYGFDYSNGGYTAMTACCICGGGVNPAFQTTPAPVVKVTPAPIIKVTPAPQGLPQPLTPAPVVPTPPTIITVAPTQAKIPPPPGSTPQPVFVQPPPPITPQPVQLVTPLPVIAPSPPTTPISPTPPAPIVVGTLIKIWSAADEDLVLTVVGGSCSPGAVIQVTDYIGADAQKFYMTNQNGVLMFHSKVCPGMLIEVDGACTMGSGLYLDNQSNSANQQWTNPINGILKSNIPGCQLVIAISTAIEGSRAKIDSYIPGYSLQMWNADTVSGGGGSGGGGGGGGDCTGSSYSSTSKSSSKSSHSHDTSGSRRGRRALHSKSSKSSKCSKKSTTTSHSKSSKSHKSGSADNRDYDGFFNTRIGYQQDDYENVDTSSKVMTGSLITGAGLLVMSLAAVAFKKYQMQR